MGEADFGLVALLRDFKRNLCALPLGLVFNKVRPAVQNKPNYLLARNEFCYLLLGVVEVFVSISKLIPELVGATFNFS